MAGLLFDYATLEAALATLESAQSLLVMAKEFGMSPAKVDSLMARYNRIIRIAKIWFGTKIGLAILSVVAFLAYCYRKGWFVIRRKKA